MHLHISLLLTFSANIVAGYAVKGNYHYRDIARPAETAASPAATITPAPTYPPSKLNNRDSLTTVSISSCHNYADPDDGNKHGCECDGYDGVVPYTTVTIASNSTSTGCDALSTIIMISSTIEPYPYTTTLANSAVVAYATTHYLDNDSGTSTAWYGGGASTIIHHGKSISLELNPTASVNVGTLTGSELFSSVSTALSQGCGTVAASATMTSCTLPEITGIRYTEANIDKLWTGGTLSLNIVFMSVTSDDVLQALIASIAGALAASSLSADNSHVYKHAGKFGNAHVNMTNVAALAQAFYAEDTASTYSQQHLGVDLSFSHGSSGDYACEASSLASTVGEVGEMLGGVLELIPGMEWVGALAEVVSTVTETAGSVEQGLSLVCQLSQMPS